MALDLNGLKKDGRQAIVQKKEEKRWNDLIDAVMDGRVIPVIGPDFLVEDDPDSSENINNLHQQIIDIITSAYGIESNPCSFSQLVYDKDFL